MLLSNRRALLPLDRAALKSVTLIGPNVFAPQAQGGGSVLVLPALRVQLAESLRQALASTTRVGVQQGCVTSATVASTSRSKRLPSPTL